MGRDGVVAAIVCGGSLVKKGSHGPCALDVLMKEWVLEGGLHAFSAETPEPEVAQATPASQWHMELYTLALYTFPNQMKFIIGCPKGFFDGSLEASKKVSPSKNWYKGKGKIWFSKKLA